jgi:hypothetical protein
MVELVVVGWLVIELWLETVEVVQADVRLPSTTAINTPLHPNRTSQSLLLEHIR